MSLRDEIAKLHNKIDENFLDNPILSEEEVILFDEIMQHVYREAELSPDMFDNLKEDVSDKYTDFVNDILEDKNAED